MINLLSQACLFAGGFFILTAGIGILRLPDTLSRAHALSKVLTFGLTLILVCLFTILDDVVSSLKIMSIVAFHLLTIPLAGHIFALYSSRKS